MIYTTVDLLLGDYNDFVGYDEVNSFVFQQFNDRNVSFKADELKNMILIIRRVASSDNTTFHSLNYIIILKNLIIVYAKKHFRTKFKNICWNH